MNVLCKNISIFTLACLTACGGDSGSTASPKAVRAIAGVWDTSEEVDGATDVHYSVIRQDGSASDYDYQGDSVDNLEDCYLKSDFTIEHESESRFAATFGPEQGTPQDLDITLQNGNIRIVFIEDNEIDVFPPADKSERDLAPICDPA